LLMVGPSSAVNATLYDKLDFVFLRDIAPVASLIREPQIMLANPSVMTKTVPELIAYAKVNPGKITMASAGVGSAGHLVGELFKMMAGVDFVHVPYRGVELVQLSPFKSNGVGQTLDAAEDVSIFVQHEVQHGPAPSPGQLQDSERIDMARRPRSSSLEHRTARLKLPVQQKPHCFTAIAPGIALAYRRGKDRNAWVVRVADGKGGNWIKNLPGIPDDFEEANGESVQTFWQAQDAARKLARGTVESGRPITVNEGLDAYAAHLAARGGLAGNVSRVRHHLPPGLATKPVALLTPRELEYWRNSLAVKPATINRMGHVVKAALNLAARHDPRITNANAWKLGLALLPNTHRPRNTILNDAQVLSLIDAANAIDPAFGLFCEVGAVT